MAAAPRPLLALILGQVCLHSCMAGVRVASPLLALRHGAPAWMVGLLLGLFAAAPVFMSLPAGRLADRHGYHRPVRLAVALTMVGALAALLASVLHDARMYLLCVAAALCGIGTNMGLIAIQRSAGKLAGAQRAEMTRVFSWLGLAPALSNVVGPVLAGALIDLSGFSGAFAALMLLPLATLAWARRVPHEPPAPAGRAHRQDGAWALLTTPGLPRLLLVNWLMSSSWDLHAFVVPVIGHERGFSASAIGLILGAFAAAVAGVRVVIPFVAERLRPAQVLVGAMLLTAIVFAIYPMVGHPLAMGVCASALGLALGSVQPMIMTTLHHLTPADRHGEAIALRSMAINASSAAMPLLFGAAGAALGAAALFWMMAAAVGAGSWAARRVGREVGRL